MVGLEELNPLQRQAVLCDVLHLLIVAGPGTGKTHTITYRIARLAEQLTQSANILAITFTNKAAEHLNSRLEDKFLQISNKVCVRTFHGFCLDVLRKYTEAAGFHKGFHIVSPVEASYFIKEACARAGIKVSERGIAREISRWKACSYKDEMPVYIKEYNRLLKENSLLDFDDILIETVELLRREQHILSSLQQRYPFIFVDEYQDINPIQHKLLKFLAGGKGAVTAIGDPNQSIYSFRGASPYFFECFQQDFTPSRVLCLKNNYRSAANILEASCQVIASGQYFDVPSTVAVKEEKGSLVIYHAPTDKAEAEYVVHSIEKMVGGTSMFSHDSARVDTFAEGVRGFSDIAVCYRLNSQRRLLQEAFDRAGIPCQAFGEASLLELRAVGEMVSFITLFLGGVVSVPAALGLLEFIVYGFGQQASGVLKQYWANKQVSISDIKEIAGNKHLISHNACRQYLQDIIHSAEVVFDTPTPIDIAEIICKSKRIPAWERALKADKKFKENIQRLEQNIAGLHIDQDKGGISSLVDFLSLQQPEDMFEFKAEKVSLLTLHASKGLEFPVVFIIGCEEGILPLERPGQDTPSDEERRLFYVGMSRAKEELILTHARRRFIHGRTVSNPPSRYLRDIEEELKRYEQAKQNKSKKAVQQQQETFF